MTLKDEEGEDVEISNLAGERGVVIFLYPKVSFISFLWVKGVGLGCSKMGNKDRGEIGNKDK